MSSSGIITIPSSHSVDETVKRLEGVLHAKGIKLFTIIDHSGEAHAAGLAMPNTKVVIFGNPKAGTPLMIASPTAALDLPLKALIREDEQGQVWISWNSSAYIRERHGLAEELVQKAIGAIDQLMNAISKS